MIKPEPLPVDRPASGRLRALRAVLAYDTFSHKPWSEIVVSGYRLQHVGIDQITWDQEAWGNYDSNIQSLEASDAMAGITL